jgi:hypothetical protein
MNEPTSTLPAPAADDECQNCGMIDKPLQDGYCAGCICDCCKRHAGDTGCSMDEVGLCEECAWKLHTFPKRCACGRQLTQEAWEALRIVGGLDPEDNEDPSYILELRNCTCGSTLSICALVKYEESMRATGNITQAYQTARERIIESLKAERDGQRRNA